MVVQEDSDKKGLENSDVIQCKKQHEAQPDNKGIKDFILSTSVFPLPYCEL